MKSYICQIIRSFMAHLQGFSDVRAKQEVIIFERQPTFLRRSPALHFCMISFVSASSLEDFCLLLHLIGTSILKTSPQCRLVEKPFDLPGFAVYVSLLVAVFCAETLEKLTRNLSHIEKVCNAELKARKTSLVNCSMYSTTLYSPYLTRYYSNPYTFNFFHKDFFCIMKTLRKVCRKSRKSMDKK